MTAGKKAGARRGPKQVIDYDPLAWLEEGGEEPALPEPQAEAEAPANADEPVASPPETVDAVEAETDPGYGFFDDAEAAETAVESSAAEEPEQDVGYGFFDDEEPAADTAKGSEPETEINESGYGFFDDAPSGGSATEAWKDEDAVIHFGAELVIRNVAQAHRLLAETLSRGFDVRIDAGDLQKIDCAGLQMIYSLVMTLEKTGQKIHWEKPSPLIDGRASEIGLPALCPADEQEGDDSAFGFF